MSRTVGDGPRSTRRRFVQGTLAAATGTALAAASPATTADPRGEAPPARPVEKKLIKHVLLFIHPPSTFSMNRLLKPHTVAEENWRKIIAEKGPNEANAVCIMRGSKKDESLEEAGVRCFGDRCVLNPSDNSDATRVILSHDLDRTLGGRGSHGEWDPYEIWSSNNARRWVEGFKKTLAERGYAYDPGSVTMETFGNWSGCHHKYSNFMAVYLGMKWPARIHAETELCGLKGVPMPVHQFVELLPMDRHVWLALFRREDGVPMAQYWDGLRPVWAPPHTARVTMDPKRVDLYSFSPNSLIPVDGAAKKLADGFIADVGDGTHPAFTTVVGHGATDREFEGLRAALAGAAITPRDDKRQVSLAVET